MINNNFIKRTNNYKHKLCRSKNIFNKIIMHPIIPGETDHIPEKVITIPSSPID